MENDRQIAAICVARLFQGKGGEIIKREMGVGYREKGRALLTDDERDIMKEMFDLFLALIQGEKMRLKVPKPEMNEANLVGTEED